MSGEAIREDVHSWLFSQATTVIGGIVFVFNLTLLCFIGKLAVSGAKNDKFGLIIHILFITLNDTLCGLFLFLIG